MRELFRAKTAVVHPYAWVIEPLEPTLVLRAMFGGKAVYLHGHLVLVLMAKIEPWRGLLIATDHPHHASLIADRPAAFAPHPILGKWLYLPETAPSFDADASWLVERLRA